MTTQQYKMQCPQCGHEQFEMPDNPQDHDWVKCNFCNHKLTVADLKEANQEQIAAVVKELAKKVLDKQIKKIKKKFR